MCIVIVLALAAVAEEAGRGSDPLSRAEIELAKGAAAAVANVASAAAQPGANGDADNGRTPANEPVLLLVERRLAERNAAEPSRLADVYSYDYSDDSLIHTIVDVETGDVRLREILRNVQLPLIEEEIQRAAAIVMSDERTRGLLERAFFAITGRKLEGIDDIEVKAFVFHASTLPDAATRESAMCGVRRCAQMITYTRDNVSLDVSPIIDLSQNRVAQVTTP